MIEIFGVKHIKDLERLHTGERFPIPNPNNELYFSKRVVTDESGNVVAIGMLKLTSEALLIVDRSAPLLSRAKATRDLLVQMTMDLDAAKIEDTHVFIDPDDARIRIFLHSFGFVDVKDDAMYLPPRSN